MLPRSSNHPYPTTPTTIYPPKVVEILSTVIEHLVKGEVMQMRGGHLRDCSALEYYFHKVNVVYESKQ
jgi:geranylgeranyl pyrophosphate synthase